LLLYYCSSLWLLLKPPSAIPNVDGLVMIPSALPSATPSVNVLAVRCNVKKHNAPSALFTANALSAVFVAPRTCVKRNHAPSVKPSAHLLNATLLAKHLNQFAALSVKKLVVIGSVASLKTAPSPSVNCNAKSLLVNLPQLVTVVVLAAVAPTKTTPWLL